MDVVFSYKSCANAGRKRGLCLIIYDGMKNVAKLETDGSAITFRG